MNSQHLEALSEDWRPKLRVFATDAMPRPKHHAERVETCQALRSSATSPIPRICRLLFQRFIALTAQIRTHDGKDGQDGKSQ